jgi:hypothetical protein
MKKYLTLILLLLIVFTSCRTKKICSGTTVYKIEKNIQKDQWELNAYKLDKNNDDFTPTADNLIVLTPAATIQSATPFKSLHLAGAPTLEKTTVDNYFYGDVSGIVEKAVAFDPNNIKDFPMPKSITYTNGYIVLQALSVPYKIRNKLSGSQYITPIQSTVETGFSANISVGYKFALSWFRPNKDILGLNTNSISITPGLFDGLSTVALSATNTLNAPTVPNRTALVNSYGFFALLGIGRFGFGYAGGWDHATGENGKYWVYKGKYWNGFALSIDLVNF